jgi:hypothetical protein
VGLVREEERDDEKMMKEEGGARKVEKRMDGELYLMVAMVMTSAFAGRMDESRVATCRA